MAARRNHCIETRRSPEGFEYTQVEGRDVTIQYGTHDIGVWRRHRHDDYQILILPDYGCEAELFWWVAGGGQNCQRVRGPHICTIGKRIAHELHWTSKAPLVSLLVSGDFVRRNGKREAMIGVSIGSEWEYSCKNIKIHQLAGYLRELCHDTGMPSPDYVHGLGLLQAACIVKARNQPTGLKRPDGLNAALMGKIIEYIETHLQEDLGVKTLARIASLGEDQFTRRFKRTTGKTPHQFVLNFKLQRAQQLMAKGGMYLCDIAAATGFADQSHLRHCLRRICGRNARNPVLS
ncbi:helix-turn-helix domain-containing protein [Termitidicoccus mucosus]|uniref:helix-turn-helix domain-containing protein n=1 Tax=Termitidicoccus mucosus TaxID=1184151 RepID=UPI000A05BBD9